MDVLETQFTQLLEKVSTTHDYETIKHAHEKYLTTLQSQLFLTQPSVRIQGLVNSFSPISFLPPLPWLNFLFLSLAAYPLLYLEGPL